MRTELFRQTGFLKRGFVSTSHGRIYYSTERTESSRASRLNRLNDPEGGLRQEHPFSVMDEYKLFEAFLSNKKRSRAPDTPYVNQIKRLRERDGQKIKDQRSKVAFRQLDGDMIRVKASSNHPHASTIVGNKSSTPDEDAINKLQNLIRSSTITSHDLDGYLKIKAPHNVPHVVTKRWLVEMLTVMINESNPKSLGAVVDLLTDYWTVGFEEGIEFSDREAYNLTQQLFNRALRIYKPTEYTVRNQEVAAYHGIDDVDVFRHFLDMYFESFEGDPHQLSADMKEKRQALYDLLFRLAAQSGRIEVADAILSDHLQRSMVPSPDSIDVLITALSKHINAQRQIFPGTDEEFTSLVKHDLVAYRALLISENVSPSVVEFLLSWSESLDEVYSILEISADARQSDLILATCQEQILNAVVRCAILDGNNGTPTPTPVSVRAMAHMFGVLNRFTHSKAGITADAYDQCLLLSAIYGNSAGMYRSLAMREALNQELPEGVHPSYPSHHIIGNVFDRLPMIFRNDGAAVISDTKNSEYWWFSNDLIRGSETIDQAVLGTLRTMISPGDFDVYRRYIGALGRFKSAEPLRKEWADIVQTQQLNTYSQDVILEFLAAFKESEAVKDGLQVLDDVLKNTNNGKSMSILKLVFRYEILPLESTLKFAASWFIRHKELSKKWPIGDIQKLFDEITSSDGNARLSAKEIGIVTEVSRAVAESVVQVRQGFDVETSMNTLNDLLAANYREMK